jgi:hypothetical protein
VTLTITGERLGWWGATAADVCVGDGALSHDLNAQQSRVTWYVVQ